MRKLFNIIRTITPNLTLNVDLVHCSTGFKLGNLVKSAKVIEVIRENAHT